MYNLKILKKTGVFKPINSPEHEPKFYLGRQYYGPRNFEQVSEKMDGSKVPGQKVTFGGILSLKRATGDVTTIIFKIPMQNFRKYN